MQSDKIVRPQDNTIGMLASVTPPATAIPARRKSSPGVLAAILAAVILTPLLRAILPAKYYYDSSFIQLLAQNQNSNLVSQSYRNTASVYRNLGLANEPAFAAVVGLAALVSLLLLPRLRLANVHGRSGVVVLGLIVLSGTTYLTQYSKDVFVLPVSGIVALMPPTRLGESALLAGMAIYAATFRSYWLLIALVYLGLRVLLSRATRAATPVIAVIVFLLLLSLLFPVVLHQSLDSIRSSLTAGRDGLGDSTTLIRPFLAGTDAASQAGNIVLTLCTLLVPLPLLALASPFYFGIAALLGGFWVWTCSQVRSIIRVERSHRDPFALRAASMLFAVVVVQSIFEPDFGSYLKHLSPVLPLAILLFSSERPVISGNREKGSTTGSQTRN